MTRKINIVFLLILLFGCVRKDESFFLEQAIKYNQLRERKGLEQIDIQKIDSTKLKTGYYANSLHLYRGYQTKILIFNGKTDRLQSETDNLHCDSVFLNTTYDVEMDSLAIDFVINHRGVSVYDNGKVADTSILVQYLSDSSQCLHLRTKLQQVLGNLRDLK